MVDPSVRALGRTGVVAIALGAMAMLSPRAVPGEAPPPAGSGAGDAGSPPLSGPQLRAAVLALLERGAPPEDWQPLGAAAVPVLEELARGAGTPPRRREEAIRSLGALEVPEAAAPLRALAADARAPDDLRARAAFALAQQQGPAAVADLEPLLQDPREPLRLGAARALGQAGGEDAKKALEDRLELEDSVMIREAIQKTLTLMQP